MISMRNHDFHIKEKKPKSEKYVHIFCKTIKAKNTCVRKCVKNKLTQSTRGGVCV